MFKISPVTFKATDEIVTKKVFLQVIQSLEAKKRRLAKQIDKNVDPKSKLTGQKYDREEALKQIITVIKKLWRLSGYEIPEEGVDKCCKKENAGIFNSISKAVGLAKDKEGEHDEHKEMWSYLDTKEMAVYKGW